MNDFLDYSVFNRWRELLDENNYKKRGRPFKVPGNSNNVPGKIKGAKGNALQAAGARTP